MSWIADFDTQGREFPTCVHVTKTTGTMTHGATYVPIEDGRVVRAENERLRSCLSDAAENRLLIMGEYKQLREENAKLRELVRDMYVTIRDRNSWWVCMSRNEKSFADRMRELGIEVDE